MDSSLGFLGSVIPSNWNLARLIQSRIFDTIQVSNPYAVQEERVVVSSCLCASFSVHQEVTYPIPASGSLPLHSDIVCLSHHQIPAITSTRCSFHLRASLFSSFLLLLRGQGQDSGLSLCDSDSFSY